MSDLPADEVRTLPAINARKKCNEGCQFYTVCPLVNLSKNDKEQRCMMKELGSKSPQYVTRFMRMFQDGEDGVLNEIRASLYVYGMKAALSDKLKDYRDYADLMLRFYKIAYADQRNRTPDDGREVKVVISEAEGRTVKTNVRGDVIDVPAEYLIPDQEDDPESLFYSPVVDEVSDTREPEELS